VHPTTSESTEHPTTSESTEHPTISVSTTNQTVAAAFSLHLSDVEIFKISIYSYH
jgi:hypothetical protein